MRLDKFLAHTGYGSRKEVKELLKGKQITVNERLVKDGKNQIDPEKDQITVSGEVVKFQDFCYFMLHKPQGVISATEDNLHKTVIDLLVPQDRLLHPFPVGRLDKDTEGLLLITNDGKLAHNLLSPKKEVDKCYEAIIEGIVDEADIQAFADGIILDDGFICRSAHLMLTGIDSDKQTSTIQVTIHEGKFHQVKRMFKAVNKKVLYLKRVTMGPLKLDETLALGKYRKLTEVEIELLKSIN